MQKLVFTNANGVEIDLTSGNYGITNWEGFSNTGLNVQTQQVPFQDGSVFLDALINDRELSVTLAIQDNNDLETRYELRRELISVLNPKLGEGVLTYTNNYLSKQIKVIPQIPLFENHNSNDSGTPKASLTFVACSPYWEDTDDTDIVIASGNATTVNNQGDIPSQVKILVDNNAEDFFISNITNDKQIKFKQTISENVVINTNIGQKSVKGLSPKSKKIMSWAGTSSTNFYARICYANGKFVIVGSENIVFDVSQNKAFVPNVSRVFRSVTYGNGVFVFTYPTITYYSVDGINWTKSSSNAGGYSIIFAEGRFITVWNSVAYTSTDGINWTSTTVEYSGSLSTVSIYNMIYSEAKDLYVGVSSEGQLLSSSNGITWRDGPLSGFQEGDVCYSDELGLFVAVSGRSVHGATSTDGITWTRNSNIPEYLEGIIYAEGLFVAVGQYGIFTSPDGTTWTQQVGDVTGLNDVIYGGGKFIAVADNRGILSSLDGINWTIDNLLLGGEFTDALYKNGIYIMPSTTYTYKSTDGMFWKPTTNNSASQNACTFGNGLFVTVGATDNIMTSPDGETWTSRTSTGSYTLNAICYSEEKGLFVAGGKIFATSSDGQSWTNGSEPAEDVNGIVYGNELFVAVGNSGSILTSPDGITWTSRTSGVTDNLNCICFVNNRFIVGGDEGTILMSTDGINWTLYANSITENFNKIIVGDELFVAVCSSGYILVSSDGIVWSKYSMYYIGASKAILYDGEIFVMEIGQTNIYQINFDESNYISYITADSDMSFNLEVGMNKVIYMENSGNRNITIRYRQKYIGV